MPTSLTPDSSGQSDAAISFIDKEILKMPYNHMLCLDAISGMRTLSDARVPLTVTSPPYDELRDFGGHAFSEELFRDIAQELWRVTCPGAS